MKTEKVVINECLIINKREACEIFDLDTGLNPSDINKNIEPLHFVPPGDKNDFVYYYSPGISIREMMDIIGKKYNIPFYSGMFGSMISIENISLSEINKTGFKLIKVSSIESLEEKNITGWRKANPREALEVFLVLLLQNPLSKDYPKIINILWKYFENGDGYCNLTDSFNKNNFVGIKIRENLEIEIFEQEKNKLGKEILNLKLKMNSIWVHE